MKRILFAVRLFFIITILFVGLKANSQTINNWGVVGTATPNGWGGPDMPLTYDANSNTWSAVVSLSNGEIKFRNNNDWAVNYGDNGADGSLDAGGSNIVVAAGTYLITLDFTTLNYSIKTAFVSIPDPNFEQALIDAGIDKDAVVNASILRSDVEAITQLDVTGKNISSLQGIEAFINLSRLLCQNNQLQVLNISKNTALTVLECGGNQLTTLNVSKNLLLRVLGFGFNNISAIDVSRNLNLEVFWCNSNNITSQNLDLNSALTVVGLSNNPLTFVSLKNGNNSKIVYFEAYNTPGLACINSDAVVPVSMTNSGKTFSENCAVTSLAGRWIIAPETGALKVGPAPGSGVWWSLSASDLVVRACYMDDKYVFGKDGSFKNVLGSATFLEPWQGVASDQCGTPVAPHNGADASYVYDQNAGTITLNGKGAYLGLPKVTNSYYLPNGPVPNSITYNVAFSENGNVMTLSISLQGGFWTYKLIKESLFKTYYVNDNASAGDLFTTATGNNANAGTKAAPFATLTHALSQAGEGDTVYVDAGGYAEQVIINKGITIIGAGQTFTSFTPPATALVPAPGPFTEIGLFETTQGIGDVHIRNLSINSINGNSQNIIIQSGGSVTNCTLLNGGQGIFFRIESGTKTALVENNTIQPNGIGINCQGSGLTATIRQNTIFSTNGYYAGIFAGLDFGPIVQLTANNNIINNYFGNGLLANSFNSNFTQNSIVGLNGQGVAIQQFSGNTANASCNWYGSALAATVVSKITGGVTYSPWLIDGTDNSPAVGFQTSATCPVANSFYVNDNSTTGDVFTTAIGNNANPGTFSAPYATLNYAIAQVPAGATIYVDAGTYAEDIVVNKGVTILGVQTGINPGSLLTRGAESILVPVSAADPVNRAVVRLQASNVIIDGFTVDGDNPALTGSVTLNGVDINAGFGFAKLIEPSAHNNIIIRNNIIRNFYRYGVFLQSTAVLPLSGNLIEQNHIDNISAQNVDGNAGRTGRGVALFNNGYASVKNNVFTRNFMGILLQTNTAPSPGTYLITGNKIESYRFGMVINNLLATSNQYLVNENEITTDDLNFWSVPGSSTTNNNTGLQVFGISNTAGLSFNNNKINDTWKGFWFDNITAPLTVNNNSITGTLSYAIQNANGNTVTANCNWYGSAAAQDFISKLTLSTVDIVPWLTNGTDNDIATGFQPVPNSCDGYPTLITLNSSTNVTCNGAANGSIDITTSYGKAPFTYTWTKEGDEAFVSHDEDLTGLTPGVYLLAILDGNGSNIYITDPEADGPGTITVTITEPDVLTASADGTNNICFNGTIGSATVIPEGGTAPYTFLWNTGATTDEIINLAAGVYSVTVTDVNGCTTTASYEVTQPTQVTASITNNSTACSNNATVTAGGGTAPYSYLWSNGSTSSSITGVIAGIYSVTVTDANGCTATASVTLTVSGAFNPTAAATDVTCFGANNGMITVTNANGTAPFTFSIDGVNFLPGAFPYSFTNLAPGTYTVAARDVNGCTGFVTRTVLQPAQLVVALTTVQSTCFGLNTGSVSVTALGGTGALSYSWTGDGGFTSSQKNISGLATGNYSLTVTDKNGCTAILNVFVPSLTQITVNSTVNNIACKGEINGSIILNVTGGTGNFTYLWNTGATTSSISNLITGNYSVTVTDIGSGCVASKSFTITQPSNVVALSTSKTNATGCASLGTITATGSGGTSPYQYSLDGINYQPSGSFTGLYAGSYIVRVKDFNGCIKTSAAISITDNGLDEYDGSGSNRNNTKSKAAPISTGVTIAGRIATTGDPEDWYKFTITTAGNYTLSLTHPSATFAFNLFTLNNATAIGTVGNTSTSKTYSLTAGDYYIQVTGGLSYVCYSLNVSSSVAARNSTTTGTVNKPPVVIATAILKARTYPNPHSGSFMLNIESPEDGNARVELFTITGQKLVERTVLLQKGENNLVPFKGISKGTVLYRVQIGKHVATGKVIGIE